MMFKACIAFGALWLVVATAMPTRAAELLNVPVYDPRTKSYFEMADGAHGLVRGTGVDHEGPNWREAYGFAQARSYKGVRGRLALVKDFETHEFLLGTFKPTTYVWIGLRYWCQARRLEWSDGKMLAPGSFQAWDKRWDDSNACKGAGPKDYMPVAYSPPPDFRWIGKGANKRFYYFFVEYATGSP